MLIEAFNKTAIRTKNKNFIILIILKTTESVRFF